MELAIFLTQDRALKQIGGIMKMAFGGTIAVALIFMCSVRAVNMAPPPAYAPAPGPAESNSSSDYEYYLVKSDVDALKSILESWTKTNTNLDSLLPGWSLEDVKPCITKVWLGVFCYGDSSAPNRSYVRNGKVVTCVALTIFGITISNTDLAGDLPPAFGNLSGIYYIYITGNSKMTGPIPKELGQLPNLEALDLHDNNFSGSIPPELGEIQYLVELDLSGNQLTGSIPGNLGNASYLYTLKLSQNFLNGSIPATFSSAGDGPGLNHLKNLMSIELMENLLTGPLPDLRNLTILTTLNVSHNQLSGAVVIDNIFNLSAYNITTLDLSSNNLSGAFPDLSKLSNSAIQLGLSDNSFDASAIPSWLSNFKSLKTLQMANNSLYGSVPTFLVDTYSLPQLQYLNLDRNSLNGSLDLSKVYPRSTGPPTLQSVNLTTNNITAVDYDPNMVLQGSSVENVHFILNGNPFCTDLERQNMSAAQNYFCRNSTTGKSVIYLADRYRKAIIAVAVILCTACLLVAAMALFLCWRNRRDKKRLYMQIQQEFAKSDVQPTLYAYSELRAATRDFNPEFKVGEGAFGVVYKGVQPDGGELAVKHLVGTSQQGIDEFLNEVVLITGVRHRNLVKLKGCCLREDKRLLVYEFVENNNLAEVLFEGKGDHDLNWGVRYNICLGVALGLQHLHENLPRIIHRDIKAPNILLDKNLNAKIADFGLARLFPDEESHISTLHIAGTTGYLAPEYASRGQLTEKADVFSYGVLVLEIVTGRRNIDRKAPVEEIYIVEHAWRCHEEGRLLDLVDNTLDIQGHEAEVERVINVALLCLQGNGQKRPSMTRAISLLKGEVKMEVVIRETYSSRAQLFPSILRRVQSDPDVTIDIQQDQHLKDFENKPLLHGESSAKESVPSSLDSSRFVELTSLTPR